MTEGGAGSDADDVDTTLSPPLVLQDSAPLSSTWSVEGVSGMSLSTMDSPKTAAVQRQMWWPLGHPSGSLCPPLWGADCRPREVVIPLATTGSQEGRTHQGCLL